MFSKSVAIKNQRICKTIIEADEAFKKSCDICCSDPRCLWNSCENCPVAEAHKTVIEKLMAEISTNGEERKYE